MLKRHLDARISHPHLYSYLQDAANDRHVARPAGGLVVKGYVLDPEEVSDNSAISIVEQRVRTLRNLAA